MTPYGVSQVNKTARKVALVTGGAIRLGRAISLELARTGYDVAVNYHRSAGAARGTVAAIGALGVRAVSIRADVAKPAETRRVDPTEPAVARHRAALAASAGPRAARRVRIHRPSRQGLSDEGLVVAPGQHRRPDK